MNHITDEMIEAAAHDDYRAQKKWDDGYSRPKGFTAGAKWAIGQLKSGNLEGVSVVIKKTSDYPTPFGLRYQAKGAYRQGKHIIVVGRIDPDNTIRIKYPACDVTITLL